MKILIADDHFLVLDGLAVLLSTIDFVSEVRQAQSKNEILEQLNLSSSDVLFLDINLGKEDGREIIRTIKAAFPDLKIIAFTSASDTSTIKSCIKAGFNGFLLKSDDRTEFYNALKAVSAGEKYYSSKTKNVVFENEMEHHNSKLSAREIEIIKLVVAEKTNKEIAADLFLSEKTVENHRANIMLKMDVKNVAGLVRKAINQGIIN